MMEVKSRELVPFSISELRILTLLAKSPAGLFASQVAHQSGGFLKRGTLYPTLDRMRKKRLIRCSGGAATAERRYQRPIYRVTKRGRDAVQAFADEFGFIWPD